MHWTDTRISCYYKKPVAWWTTCFRHTNSAFTIDRNWVTVS